MIILMTFCISLLSNCYVEHENNNIIILSDIRYIRTTEDKASELPITDPPRSGLPLYNGQTLCHGLNFSIVYIHYEPPRSGQPPNSL